MQIWLTMLGSFLLGSIPTAYIIVKIKQQSDIRFMGSGNVGTMNVRGQMGYGPALLVLLIDAAKGAGAIFLCRLGGVDPALGLAMAVGGHIYPPWLSFHGGRGLATALGGVLAAGYWAVFMAFAIVWLPVYLLVSNKNGDLSNLAGALGIAVYYLFAGPNWGLILMGLLIAVKHWQALRKV
jgi:glycerol-3-phosphate acyltransferase PlsY